MKRIVLVFVVFVALCVSVILFFAETMIKRGVEVVGSNAAQAQISVGSVNLSILSGSLLIKDFVVGNPKGFKSEHAFALKELAVQLDVLSLLQDVIHIQSVIIDAPSIHYEVNSKGSNMEVLKHNIQQRLNASSVAKDSSNDEVDAQPISQNKNEDQQVVAQKGVKKKVVISRLDIIKATVYPHLGYKAKPIVLQDIHMKDLGKSNQGATFVAVGLQVTQAVLDKITAANFPMLAEKLIEKIGDNLKGLDDDLKKGITEGIQKLF